MRRYRLPYWAFVPMLGVWPDARFLNGTGTAGAGAAVPLPPASGAIAVNLDNGKVFVNNIQPETRSTDARPSQRLLEVAIKRKHLNTPSVGGPSWLRKTTTTTTTTRTTKLATDTETQTAVEETADRPVTKIYLKPSARAKAGVGGVALSNPISTAVVRRGDTVSIEYLPDAMAEAGEGGVAISRPELVIHLVD